MDVYFGCLVSINFGSLHLKANVVPLGTTYFPFPRFSSEAHEIVLLLEEQDTVNFSEANASQSPKNAAKFKF